jgi:hypothetical protein
MLERTLRYYDHPSVALVGRRGRVWCSLELVAEVYSKVLYILNLSFGCC